MRYFNCIFISILAFAIIFCTLDSAQAGSYGGGSGTEEDPYQIWTAAEFDSLRCNQDDWGLHFIMMANIDDTDYNGCGYKNIIGYDARPAWGYKAFTGVFDGNGHTISGFTYYDYGGPIGLFGYVLGENAAIKNLGLINPIMDSPTQDTAGLLVAYLEEATISNCFVVNGSVRAKSEVGVLVGENDAGIIINCYATGIAEAVYDSENEEGGLIVGGLVAVNNGMVENCYAASECIGTGQLGGLVGLQGEIGETIDSFWDAEVSGLSNMCGSEETGAIGCDDTAGKNTAEMKQQATFTNWDFIGETANGEEDIWRNVEGQTYPLLAWELFGGGNGTAEDPYQIWTAAQFDILRCNNQHNWDKHYILMVDIDDTHYHGCSWQNVIGYDARPAWGFKAFTGVFDGNGHTITGFTYYDYGGPIGMFGYVAGEGAAIKNLGLINPIMDSPSQDTAGILVGSLEEATVSNCYIINGSVKAKSEVGLLVGKNEAGIISNCYVIGYAEAVYDSENEEGGQKVGGIVGVNNGIVEYCYAVAEEAGTGQLGGLIGLQGEIGETMDSYWDAEVSGLSDMCGGQEEGAFGCDAMNGKTTSEMKQQSTFTGFDFIDIWAIGDQQTYPYLRTMLAGDINQDGIVNLPDLCILAEQWLSVN